MSMENVALRPHSARKVLASSPQERGGGELMSACGLCFSFVGIYIKKGKNDGKKIIYF